MPAARSRRRAAAVATVLAAAIGILAVTWGDGQPAPSVRPPGPVVVVDPRSVGGPCDDGRSAAAAADPRTPWCSVAHAVSAARAHTAIELRGGRYERIEVEGQRASRPIVIRPYGRERVELPDGFLIDRSAGVRLERLIVPSPGFTSSVFRSRQIAIVGCEFTGQGLLIRSATQVLVSGNLIHRLAHRAGAPAPDGYGLVAMGYWDGGPGEAVRDLVIRGNRFLDIPQDGIQLAGGEPRMLDVTIEGNEFGWIRHRTPADHSDGIQIIGGDGIRIRGNRFHDSDDALLAKDDITRGLVLENNTMQGGPGSGIQVQLWDTPRARVEGNTISGSVLGGLRLAHLPSCCPSPQGIVVRGNRIDQYAVEGAEWVAEQDDNVIGEGPLRGERDRRPSSG